MNEYENIIIYKDINVNYSIEVIICIINQRLLFNFDIYIENQGGVCSMNEVIVKDKIVIENLIYEIRGK